MQNEPIVYMVACPNCGEPTIPYSHEAGLLTDWCDACNKSIFDSGDPYQHYIDPDHAAQQMEDNREL